MATRNWNKWTYMEDFTTVTEPGIQSRMTQGKIVKLSTMQTSKYAY